MIMRDRETQRILKYEKANVGVQAKNITIRMDDKLLEDIKEISAREGIPYQTKMKDILREYVDRVNRIYKEEQERNDKARGI